MADIKQDHKGEDVDSYGMANSADPKNMQELTQYVSPRIYARDDDDASGDDPSRRDPDATLTPLQVQTLLQNMQDKFQTMSDQIIGRNILFLALNLKRCTVLGGAMCAAEAAFGKVCVDTFS